MAKSNPSCCCGTSIVRFEILTAHCDEGYAVAFLRSHARAPDSYEISSGYPPGTRFIDVYDEAGFLNEAAVRLTGRIGYAVRMPSDHPYKSQQWEVIQLMEQQTECEIGGE